jgi:hypothetical protein
MTSDVMRILPATELNMNYACLVEVTFELTNLSRAQRRFPSLASTSALPSHWIKARKTLMRKDPTRSSNPFSSQ